MLRSSSQVSISEEIADLGLLRSRRRRWSGW